MPSAKQTESFSAKLESELSTLTWEARNELLIRLGRSEQRLRQINPDLKPVWRGPLSEMEILGKDVVVPTDQGEQRGRVVCFGIVQSQNASSWPTQYERSVVVHIPSSGTQHEAAGSSIRLATAEDRERIQNEIAMAARLAEVAAMQTTPTPLPQRVQPKKRGQKDPKLIELFVKMANEHKNVRTVEDGSANYKVTGLDSSKRLYVFKSQLRVDVSGFSFDHPGLRKISDDEARDMHLGKVRGQVLFDDRDAAIAAFGMALDGLK